MPEKKNVLIVEDDRTIREVLSALLSVGDLKVFCCDNGITALDLSKHKDFQVVITDYNLHGMDGVFVTRAMRAQFPDCLIIGISAERKKEEFLEAGADAFFTKPFPFGEFISFIKRKCG